MTTPTHPAVGMPVTVDREDRPDTSGVVRTVRTDGTADTHQTRVVVETADGDTLDVAAARCTETSPESVL